MSENNRERRRRSSSSSSASSARRSSRRSSSASRTAAARPSGSNHSIMIIVLSLIVIISIIAGAFYRPKKTAVSQENGETAQEVPSNIEVEEGDNKLLKNQQPEVNELIASYRKAFQDGDVELLKKVYNTDEEINPSILTGTSAVIEEYRNTQYYTKRGREAGEFVAFVYDELKLADIKTLAPNLSVFYIKPDESGELYVYRGEYNSATGTYEYDEQTQSYLDSLYQDKDVIDLITSVNTRMDSACANDEDLMNFMDKLRSQTDDTISAASAPESSASESGAESESSAESQAESAAETEAETVSESAQETAAE